MAQASAEVSTVDMIVRRVKVDRSRTPQAMLDATGFEKYADPSAFETMPKGEGNEAEVFFFTLYREVDDKGLEKEYALRGLMPADPYSLAALNEADPTFTDKRPNATHWKDKYGWCGLSFNKWDDGLRHVSLQYHNELGGFHIHKPPAKYGCMLWFAGIKK